MESRNITAALIVIIAFAWFTDAARSVKDSLQGILSPHGLLVSTDPEDRTMSLHLLYNSGAKALTVRCNSDKCVIVLSNVETPSASQNKETA